MKKTIFTLVILLIMVSVMSTRLIADGTEPPKVSGVYQVSILDHLEWISTNSGSWGADFIQTANIDATDTQNWNSGAGFSPIGTATNRFSGSYDGDEHTINGLYINASSTDYCGLFGYINNANISHSGVINVNISANSNIGGLVGYNRNGTVTECYSTGSVNGVAMTANVGGLVGFNFNGTVTECYSTCSVSGSYFIGGLVGRSRGYFTVSNCYSTGSVSGSGYIGGLFGYNFGSGIVSNCYSTGSVTGYKSAGGLVGSNSYSTVSNCYSTGSVTGSGSRVGGLVGDNDGTVSNCYSNGSVTGSGSVGGLVGDNTGTVSNSFWDTQTSGQSISAGGEGKTTAEMTTQSTFTSAGWNFTTIWQILCNYPDLINNPRPPEPCPPILLQPTNSSTILTLTPSLDWNDVNGASSYNVQVSLYDNFSPLLYESTDLMESQYTIPVGLLHNTQYYWRVNATNANGTGGWSDVWDFTIIIAPPTLVSPENGSVVEVLIPLLDWDDVDGALNYNTQVSLLNDFSSILYEVTGLTESNCLIPNGELTTNTLYYWRVNASNSAGASPWSEVFNFITYSTPSEKTEMLITTIDSLKNAGILNAGNANSLKSKLNNALDKISQGKINAAINILNAFKNQINALVNSNKLTPAQGEALVERTDALIEQISGENIQQIVQIPKEFKLDQNYPNPFNPTTRIDYSLPFDSKVSLQIFDVLGREVITLVNDNQRAGYYSIDFNASNLASGIYYYRMSTGDFVAIKKMVVIK